MLRSKHFVDEGNQKQVLNVWKRLEGKPPNQNINSMSRKLIECIFCFLSLKYCRQWLKNSVLGDILFRVLLRLTNFGHTSKACTELFGLLFQFISLHSQAQTYREIVKIEKSLVVLLDVTQSVLTLQLSTSVCRQRFRIGHHSNHWTLPQSYSKSISLAGLGPNPGKEALPSASAAAQVAFLETMHLKPINSYRKDNPKESKTKEFSDKKLQL